MINTVALTGRLTAEPEIKVTPNGVSVMSFAIANDKKRSEDTNFINCVAWRNTAEFINKYFHKGDMIGIEGEIQTRKYTDKNGNNRIAVEVLVNNVSFCGAKRDNSNPAFEQPAPQYASPDNTDFEEIPDEDDDDLPF